MTTGLPNLSTLTHELFTESKVALASVKSDAVPFASSPTNAPYFQKLTCTVAFSASTLSLTAIPSTTSTVP